MGVWLRLLAPALVVMAAIPVHAERVPEAGVVNGVPQGIFFSRSLLTGRAVCLLFLSGGRVTRFIPAGGLENFDWARHQAAHGPDSGTWTMSGGQLRIAWGDGGVHVGPLTAHPDGIEFYGKRYAKPAAVTVAAIAGRWEAARGTAIAGGAGINRVSTLVIQADGRYQWAATTGGVVSGRAAASDKTMTGQLTIAGATMTLKSDAGTVTTATFLPAAGTPVQAFSLDADLFTRSGAAAVAAEPPPPPASSSNSHRGLSFTLPPGWTGGLQQGSFVLTPASASPGSAVLVVVYGAERLSSSFDGWLGAKMAADLTGGLKVLQSAPPTRGRPGGLDVLSAGRTVQDPRGAVLLQIYYAVSDGRQTGLAMVATASEAALQTNMPAVQALFQSLRFQTTPDARPPSTPGTSAAPAKTTVTAADLVGHWEHASSNRVAFAPSAADSARGYGQGYTFSSDGTYQYQFVGTIDRAFLRESDDGTWAVQGRMLVLRSRGRNSIKTHQIVQWQTTADGGTVLTLLLDSYAPTDSNVNVWGEKYLRKAK